MAVVLLFAGALHAALPPLPGGNNGIASQHPNDQGIAADSRVIFADNFESGNLSAWRVSWDARLSAASAYAGSSGVEFRIPNAPNSEVGAGIDRAISPAQSVIFLRYYSKYDPAFGVTSGHNGAGISSSYWVGPDSGPGYPADGYNKFHVGMEPVYPNPDSDQSLFISQLGLTAYLQQLGLSKIPSPGVLGAYAYWPKQNCPPKPPLNADGTQPRYCYGDYFFANGFVVGTNGPSYNAFDSSFTPLPNVIPPPGWHCYEMMVKANTAAKDAAGAAAWIADGRVAFWLDGKLVADWPNLALRYTPDLGLDLVGLSLHANPNVGPATWRHVDNVVLATSYIGPMTSAAPADGPPSRPKGLKAR